MRSPLAWVDQSSPETGLVVGEWPLYVGRPLWRNASVQDDDHEVALGAGISDGCSQQGFIAATTAVATHGTVPGCPSSQALAAPNEVGTRGAAIPHRASLA